MTKQKHIWVASYEGFLKRIERRFRTKKKAEQWADSIEKYHVRIECRCIPL